MGLIFVVAVDDDDDDDDDDDISAIIFNWGFDSFNDGLVTGIMHISLNFCVAFKSDDDADDL